MSLNFLDAELFISEVQKQPVIWDYNHEHNRHFNKKNQAWEEIARKTTPGFDHMTKCEKIEILRKLHGKWRNFRDSYVRDMKKKSGQKRYMYAKHLTFLSNLYKVIDNEYEWGEEGDSKKLSNAQTYEEVQFLEDSYDEAPAIKRLKKEEEENPLEFIEAPTIEEVTTGTNVPVDEDRSFFESLLPAVRDFDIDKKLEFRSEVIRLIQKIRSE